MTRDARLRAHRVILVVPFRHEAHAAPAAHLDGRWRPWWSRLESVGATERVLDDTWFFLPHVRRLLFSDIARLGGDGAGRPTRQLVGELARRTPSEIIRPRASDNGVVRLTSTALDPLRHLRADVPGRAGSPLAIRLRWADVVLFPGGIGFLLLSLGLGEGTRLSELRDVLAQLRHLHPPSIGSPVAWLRAGAADEAFTVRDLVDYLLADVVADAQAPASPADAGRAPRYSETHAGQVYSSRARVFAWASTDLPVPESRSLDEPANRALVDLLLCADTRAPEWTPSREALERLWREQHLSFWESWHGAADHDNAIFLGLEGLPFNDEVVAHVAEADYLPLYLLVLYQQLRLNRLAEELTEPAVTGQRRLSLLRRITGDVVGFRNRFWFAEVCGSPQGQALYVAFRRALGVEALFAVVDAEARELRGHLEERGQRSTTLLVAVLTTVAAPVGATLAFFGALRRPPADEVVLAAAGAALLVGLLTLAALQGWRRLADRRGA